MYSEKVLIIYICHSVTYLFISMRDLKMRTEFESLSNCVIALPLIGKMNEIRVASRSSSLIVNET